MTFTIPLPIQATLDSLARDLQSENTPNPSAYALPSPDPPTRLTPVVAHVRAVVHAALPPYVENHSYRCYAWGALVAHRLGWNAREEWDPELWLLTALLHDVGCAKECAGAECRLSFEIWGGVKAREMLLQQGAHPHQADEVCEGIVRHTQTNETKGSVRLITALMQLAPLQDFLAAFTPSYVHPEDIKAVCARWPRRGAIYHFGAAFGSELLVKPGCFSETWAPEMMARRPGGNEKGEMKRVEAYAGLEGERGDGEDEEWEKRRATVDLGV